MALKIKAGKRLGNNYLSHNRLNCNISNDLFVSLGLILFLFSGSFLITFIVSSQFMPVSDSLAADIAVVNTARGYYADISSLGGVSLETIASPEGTSVVGKDTLTIDTNAKNGYKLYISTTSNATGTGLYPDNYDGSGSGSSNFIHPLTTGTTSSPVALGTNTWGYAPSRTNSSQTPTVVEEDDASFIGLPEYGSENLLYTNTSPTIASTNTLDVYYGTNTTTALPSGDYNNSVIYTAIVDGAIDGEGNQASINPSYQEGLAGGSTVTIATGLYPGFSMSDMGTITVTIGGDTCASPTPALSEIGSLNISCTAPAKTALGKYPVVVTIDKYDKTYNLEYEYSATTFANAGFAANSNIQDMTASICNLVAIGETTTAIDARDTKTYNIAKLADNKCWMTSDLKFENPTLTLDSSNSNIPSGSFTIENENTGTWCTTTDDSCYQTKNWTKSGAPNGYYYNWYVATAGTTGFNGSNPTADICPKGWQLPSGGPSGDFANLDKAMGGSGSNRTDATQRDKFLAAPVSMNYTGYRYGGSTNGTSAGAYYWSRTVNDNYGAYGLYSNSSGNLSPQSNYSKYYGFAIRCIAKSDYQTMQEFDASTLPNTGDSTTITDARDGKNYTVARLADGKVWMTSDLKFERADITLNSSNSNIPSGSSFTIGSENTGTWCTSNNDTCHQQKNWIKTGVPNGYLYNYYTATAGTTGYNGSNPTADICPKGWQLPSGGPSGDFVNLDKAMGGNGNNRTDATQRDKFLASPVSMNYTGNRYGGSTYDAFTYAYYWSRTATYGGYTAYNLVFSSSGTLNPQGYNVRISGFAIRCVAK